MVIRTPHLRWRMQGGRVRFAALAVWDRKVDSVGI